jgi:hypothetical protein
MKWLQITNGGYEHIFLHELEEKTRRKVEMIWKEGQITLKDLAYEGLVRTTTEKCNNRL